MSNETEGMPIGMHDEIKFSSGMELASATTSTPTPVESTGRPPSYSDSPWAQPKKANPWVVGSLVVVGAIAAMGFGVWELKPQWLVPAPKVTPVPARPALAPAPTAVPPTPTPN